MIKLNTEFEWLPYLNIYQLKHFLIRVTYWFPLNSKKGFAIKDILMIQQQLQYGDTYTEGTGRNLTLNRIRSMMGRSGQSQTI